jgi:hypothetical protein
VRSPTPCPDRPVPPARPPRPRPECGKPPIANRVSLQRTSSRTP